MKANAKYLDQSLEFWANIKLISQKAGYTERGASSIKVPSIDEIVTLYRKSGLNPDNIVLKGQATRFATSLIEYFQHRADSLNNFVKPNLMNCSEAKAKFTELQIKLDPKCPLPLNKQKGKMKDFAFFTGIINMLIEYNSVGYSCDYDPRELTAFTKNNQPIRSLSRRVDGAFPGVINPIAIWEIKEYYYTTTFGSRVADGVYESLLDGYELSEVRKSLNQSINHYLMIDDYNTWWNMGRSYLCRICDMLHMGMITEVLFGKEVLTRIPQLVTEWKHSLAQRGGFAQ